MKATSAEETQSEEITAIIMKLGDWRGQRLAQIRSLIKDTDPEIIEEVKWKKATNPDGVPVWSHDGIICIGEFYKNHLRISFPKGASLDDPKGLFNAHRAIIIHEEDTIDEAAFKDLIQAATELNHGDKNKTKTSK
ncbi:MAG TPA: DUF1801 domain-containing protein [Candidatus Saccharimonadales bacterium]|nr:DUF1801 domain-containing protein [Candidatus Saccharimonadales bacterium]